MIKDIDKRISRAMSGVRQAFRGILKRTSDTSGGSQLTQVDGLAGETLQDNELFQDYGFTSHPPPGTMAVVLPIGGKTSHGIVIATEHGQYRLKALKAGEVALYTDEGAQIVLKRGRIIETDCDVFRVNCKSWEVNASASADFNTPTLSTSAVLNAQGQINGSGGMTISGGDGAAVSGGITATQDIVANGISLISHAHTDSLGGETTPPLV